MHSLGHQAEALDLPGHGLDRTPRQKITRKDYVDAVSDYLESQDIKDVVLVGHSLAGTVLPEIFEKSSHRISQIIFLAALVLDKNEAPIDLIPEDRRKFYYDAAAKSSDNSFQIEKEKAHQIFFSDLSDEIADRVYPHLTPQPFGVYLDAAQKSISLPVEKTRYVICSEDRALPFELCRSCAKKLNVEIEEIQAGHDVMLSKPKELAEMLVNPRYNNPRHAEL